MWPCRPRRRRTPRPARTCWFTAAPRRTSWRRPASTRLPRRRRTHGRRSAIVSKWSPSPTSPAGPRAGKPIQIRLMHLGKPLAGCRVSFIPRGVTLAEDFDSKYERLTDKEGRASFTPDHGNYHLIVAHHLAPDERGPGHEGALYTRDSDRVRTRKIPPRRVRSTRRIQAVTCLHKHRYPFEYSHHETSLRFHLDRAAGRHRDHRHPDRPPPAGRAEGARGRPRASSASTTSSRSASRCTTTTGTLKRFPVGPQSVSAGAFGAVAVAPVSWNRRTCNGSSTSPRRRRSADNLTASQLIVAHLPVSERHRQRPGRRARIHGVATTSPTTAPGRSATA